MSAALQRSGFGEVGTVWQRLDNRVLVAILGDSNRTRLHRRPCSRLHLRCPKGVFSCF
jgi:hypothetical protein